MVVTGTEHAVAVFHSTTTFSFNERKIGPETQLGYNRIPTLGNAAATRGRRSPDEPEEVVPYRAGPDEPDDVVVEMPTTRTSRVTSGWRRALISV
ncbi:hypothetical protein GCM10027444_18670 [Actinopolyspora lacussalsi]